MVRTNIANVERNRPAELRNETIPLSPEMQAGRAAFKALLDAATPPVRMADAVFDAIQREQFYIFTHPEWMEVVQLRTDKLLRMENPQDPVPTILKMIQSRV